MRARGLPEQSARERAEAWRAAVKTHQPGEADGPASEIGGLAHADLVQTFEAVQRARLSEAEIKRGAVLHLDIALHLDARASGLLYRAAPRGAREPIGGTLLVQDGRFEGRSSLLTHLEVARRLLTELPPDVARDQFVALLYGAAAAALADRRNFAELSRHLDEGRRLLPDDADLLLASGYLHESYAAPRHQALVRDPRHPGLLVTVGTERTNLVQAERYLRRAADRAPRSAEVRLRLGRVLVLQGNHDEGEGHLRAALEGSAVPEDRYYALLFLGRSLELRGRPDEAGVAFTEAATLFPRAQSPPLALSRLALARGDHDEAARLLRRHFDTMGPAAGPAAAGDPWWEYGRGPGRAVAEKAGALKAAVEALR